MKKNTVLFLLIVMLSFCACGNELSQETAKKESFIREKLCAGPWVDEITTNVYGMSINFGHIYMFYEKGTFEDAFGIGGGIDTIETGTYTIDSDRKQISLVYDEAKDGETTKPKVFPYYLNEYNQKLVLNPRDDGTSNFEQVK